MANIIQKNIIDLMASIAARIIPEKKYNRPTVSPTRKVQYQLKRQSSYKIDLEIARLDQALALAESEENPDRRLLYLLYKQVVRDEQVFKESRNWMDKVLAERWVIVNQDKRIGERFESDPAKLIEKSWFYQFCKYALESWLWGHSLIEFDTDLENGMFRRCDLVPREHVRPEYGDILIRQGDSKGLPFRTGPISTLPLVEVGKERELGVLAVLTRTVIKKRYNETDWLRRNEKYGTPFLIIQTESDDDTELQKKEEMAAGFGSNAYAILDDTDKVELLESNQAFTYQTFKDFIALMDDYIAKTVNGAVLGETDPGALAKEQVSERTADTLGMSTMRWLEFVINDQLFPLLRKYKYALPEGLRFEFYATTEEARQEAKESRMGGAAKDNSTIDESAGKKPMKPEAEKKKPLIWPAWPGKNN